VKRQFFRLLFKMFGTRRSRDKWASIQATCLKCHKTQTSIFNKECSDCMMERALRNYHEGSD
jgi:hypothetical protein